MVEGMKGLAMIADISRLGFGARRLSEMPRGVIYGFTIRWGDRTMTATGFETKEACEMAREAEFANMRQEGWTPPRWWQFWRSGDTRG